MDVYHCPECVLRFRYASELEDHLRNDHPSFEVTPKTLEDALLLASHRHRHPRQAERAGRQHQLGALVSADVPKHQDP